jgi:hypothetical protein
MSGKAFPRFSAGALCLAVLVFVLLPVVLALLSAQHLPPAGEGPCKTDRKGASPPLEVRMAVEQLRNPFWYDAQGQPEEARTFWDRDHWQRVFTQWAEEGYNALLYWPEPWTETAWQGFLIRHVQHPEAREISVDQADRIIAHVNWIFHEAHVHGLKNLLFNYCVVTTAAFARAHGMAQELPVSAQVDHRHNLKGQMGPAYGVRDEKTRAFTEAAIAELFQTYPDLDGLCGGLGEALPGKRSEWYREAIAPGLKGCGRRPLSLVMNWMLPLEDFLVDVKPNDVYDNTWVTVLSNVEMLTDPRPYPAALEWADRSGKPVLFEIAHHNHEANFPFNSPRLAHDIVRQYRRVESCKGFLAWFLRYDSNDLFRAALGYYGQHDEPYSDEPWLARLVRRFGDMHCAEHFLKAYDAAARIPTELSALAWAPHDLGTSRQLLLSYWYWTEEDPRWSYLASPSRAGVLLPLRHYARVVARKGPSFRDNNGADFARNGEHPGAQELIWGLGDYPVTPEAHMRHIRQLGEICRREAEAALQTVATHHEEATAIVNYMRAYDLLAAYYERKVLAAVAALIHEFGGGPSYRAESERLADEAGDAYEKAIRFIWKEIDKEHGAIKGRWDGRQMTLPELIEREKQERKRLAQLFHWPSR